MSMALFSPDNADVLCLAGDEPDMSSWVGEEDPGHIISRSALETWYIEGL